ncbi:hypothetical protein V1511DRAFT_504239 [Dipodascopsis uninucleata]
MSTGAQMASDPPKRKRGRPPLHRPSIVSTEAKATDMNQKEEAAVHVNDADDDDDDDDDEEEEDEEEEEEEEEEDDDEDEYDESKSRPRGRPTGPSTGLRHSTRVKPKKYEEDDDDMDGRTYDDKRRKRGRPPTVDKPYESRIKSVMRALRKARSGDRFLHSPFERLPDAKQYPEYYREIKQPIAIDMIRKKIKRRQYPDIETFLSDLRLMFNNAKEFNSPNSQIFKDTMTLQKLVNNVASEEMKKPDSAFQDPESSSLKHARLPLDGIEHKGEIYRVGDWVHISNLNDPQRPTIAQIFRTWQAPDGRKWINACWYYRPEQTVHRWDKLFYENEVVKSGQYRDHLIDEVIEKCFVMFFTKYQRGRPVGIGNRAVYCCESRYNENEKTFNKIRTWKACIPDEIRSTDYEMDMFDRPRRLKRVASPIKHLLPADAKEDDPIPEPKLGVENAPPIIGAVYKRPPDPNMKERTPTPDPPTPSHMSGSQMGSMTSPYGHNASVSTPDRLASAGTYGRAMSRMPDISRFAPGMPGMGTPTPPTMGYSYQTSMHTGVAYSPGMPPVNRSTVYNPPPPPSTFTLPDYITERIPPETAELFQKDENGKLLWFSVPPVESMPVIDSADIGKGITGHSVEFLAQRNYLLDKRLERKALRDSLFKRIKLSD